MALPAVVRAAVVLTSVVMLAGCSGGDASSAPPVVGECGVPKQFLGCIEHQYSGPSDAPTVVMIGDSITHLSRLHLHDELDGYAVKIAGRTGATASQGANNAVQYASDQPRVLVVNLGTNDAWDGVPTKETTDALRALVDRFPFSCTLGVTITTHGAEASANGRAFSPQLAEAINAELPGIVDVVVDWASAAQTSLDLEEDGVHPTEQGARRLAELVADGVGSCDTS